MKTDAVPVFPTGIIGIYKNPNNFSNDFDPTHFKIEKYDGANKYRTGKFVNVLKDDSLTELRKWISECVEDYLKNELHMRYESFFFSTSIQVGRTTPHGVTVGDRPELRFDATAILLDLGCGMA